jgi:hypothetical protein
MDGNIKKMTFGHVKGSIWGGGEEGTHLLIKTLSE